jgi:hypothetical protein
MWKAGPWWRRFCYRRFWYRPSWWSYFESQHFYWCVWHSICWLHHCIPVDVNLQAFRECSFPWLPYLSSSYTPTSWFNFPRRKTSRCISKTRWRTAMSLQEHHIANAPAVLVYAYAHRIGGSTFGMLKILHWGHLCPFPRFLPLMVVNSGGKIMKFLFSAGWLEPSLSKNWLESVSRVAWHVIWTPKIMDWILQNLGIRPTTYRQIPPTQSECYSSVK